MGRRFLAPWNLGVAAARCAGADEDGIPVSIDQFAQAIDPLVIAGFHPEIDDVATFLVNDVVGEAEFWDLAAHHAAGRCAAVEHRDLVAEDGQIARHGQRGGAGTDAGDALAVLCIWRLGQAVLDVVLEVGANALQATDRHRFLVHPATPTGGLAGAIADSTENPRKHVGTPVDHVSIRIAARGNQADVLGNGGMGRTGPLTVHDLVKIVGGADVRRFHVRSVSTHSVLLKVRQRDADAQLVHCSTVRPPAKPK